MSSAAATRAPLPLFNASVLAAALALLPPSDACAATCRPSNGLSSCIDADALWPHAGGGSFFALGSPTTTPGGAVSVGVVTTFFTQAVGAHVASADPAGSTAFLVDNALDLTLLLAWGVTDRLELTLAMPWTVYQTGAGLVAVSGQGEPLPHTAARDFRFGLSFNVVRRAPGAQGPALSARAEVAAPSGSPDAFATNPTAVGVPSVTFAYRVGRVDLCAELVARIRGEAQLSNAVVGTEVGGGLGATVDVVKERWLGLGAEAFVLGATSAQRFDPANPTASVAPLVPAEWIAHARTAHFLGGDLGVGFGGGTTLPFTPHGALTSPHYRLDLSVRYAPTGDKNTR